VYHQGVGERTPLVLLPGLDGSGRLFQPLLAELPKWIEPVVVAYPPERARFDELLPIARERLPGSRAFALLGESFSGPLALMLAAERPKGLLAIVLAASFVQSPVRMPWPRLWANSVVLGLRPRVLLRALLLGGDASPQLVRELEDSLAGIERRVLARRVREIASVDARTELRTCGAPLLYLAAGRDRLVGPRCARAIAAARPDAEVVTLDAPHLVLQRRPRESARAIAEFLARAHERALVERAR